MQSKVPRGAGSKSNVSVTSYSLACSACASTSRRFSESSGSSLTSVGWYTRGRPIWRTCHSARCTLLSCFHAHTHTKNKQTSRERSKSTPYLRINTLRYFGGGGGCEIGKTFLGKKEKLFPSFENVYLNLKTLYPNFENVTSDRTLKTLHPNFGTLYPK